MPRRNVSFREFTRFEVGHQKKFGDILTVDVFEEGEFVDVVGTSKGKGFQGVIIRHNFGGVGDSTHGQHNRLRAPGSIGASSYPSGFPGNEDGRPDGKPPGENDQPASFENHPRKEPYPCERCSAGS